MILRAFLVALLIAMGEIANGNFRVRILQRKFGRKKGKQISFFSGVTIFALIAYLLVPWIQPQSIGECLGVGLIWVAVLTLVDLYFGKYVFRFSRTKIFQDFNPLKGNLLGVGMLLLLLLPMLVYLVR